jgi:hypothetical protein
MLFPTLYRSRAEDKLADNRILEAAAHTFAHRLSLSETHSPPKIGDERTRPVRHTLEGKLVEQFRVLCSHRRRR